jgi:hypothetical protein
VIEDPDAPRTALSVERGRQQTLTQIQFPPRPSLGNEGAEDDDGEALRPIQADGGGVGKRGAKKRKSVVAGEDRGATERRPKQRLKKHRSTLTQMDFLALRKAEREQQENGEGLGMTGNGDDEKENFDPGGGGKVATGKRKSEGLFETGKQSGKKRKKASDVDIGMEQNENVTATERTPKTRQKSHRKALSEQGQKECATPMTPRSTKKTRSTTKAKAEALKGEPPLDLPNADKENVAPLQDSSAVILATPKRSRNVIPSSQSPESIALSSRRGPATWGTEFEISPLKEWSSNVTPRAKPGLCRDLFASTILNKVSPKKKVCVLKYGPGMCQNSSPHGTNRYNEELGAHRAASPSGPSPHPKKPISGSPMMGSINPDNICRPTETPLEPEIPETSQLVQPEVIRSSQPEADDDDEIPETSQGLRRVTSTPSVNRNESLEMLPVLAQSPSTATTAHDHEMRSQVCNLERGSGVETQDFASNVEESREQQGRAVLNIGRKQTNAVATGASLPLKLCRASTIRDSEDEEEDGEEDEAMIQPERIMRDVSTRLVSRSPGLPTDSLSRTQLASNSPTLLPPPIQTIHQQATTTLIPTKLPRESSTSATSSPTLPPPPLPGLPRTLATQQSIRPASLTRPSQVSTQAPTQQTWLPMSSLPFANHGMTSSPTLQNSGEIEHVTIKDSSSIPTPLGAIPSQPPSQAVPLVDLGPDDDDDDDGFLDRDDDLDPRSSPLRQPTFQQIAEIRDPSTQRYPRAAKTLTTPNQKISAPIPNPSEPENTPKHNHTSTTKKKQRVQDHPLAHLNLPDSMLESLPGPPGWVPPPPLSSSLSPLDSQGSWVGRMI